VNFRASIGGVLGTKPPQLERGVWEAPAPQHEERAPYFINSGGVLTEGGGYLHGVAFPEVDIAAHILLL